MKLGTNLERTGDPAMAAPRPADYEALGFLPSPAREAIIKKAAMEAYYFLFDKEFERKDGQRFQVRAVLRQRLIDKLKIASSRADRVVIVAHSMGTMLAYDVLRNCEQCSKVDVLITLGSPLSVSEVQNELSATGDGVDFPAQKLDAWFNFYDPLDPICTLDPRLAGNFAAVDGKAVVDVKESNWGSWRHTITHYFAGTQFRATFAKALGVELG
jgi:pimeloyl-ACP methyl ester carboxylesterase